MQSTSGRSKENLRFAPQLMLAHSEAEHLHMQKQRRSCAFNVAVTVMIMAFINLMAEAQSPATPMTIGQAVENAVRNYPSVLVSQEQVTSAAAGIDLARTAYLPRVDSIAQVNRA